MAKKKPKKTTTKHPRTTPREAALRILRELHEAGHVAYLAGGCVRDRLLGFEPKDYDIATDAPPDVVKAMFRRTQAVGEAFGVVLVSIGRQRVEVATFRDEFNYEDGRRPSHVEFCDAQRDAQRRDFTINGLFEDPQTDPPTIIDYVGGQSDLADGVVRAIGNPHERFAEDYLRMLRAPRFAARLGFEIEPNTAAAVAAHAPHLSAIARERIGHEVRLMLTGPGAHESAGLMQALQLDAPTLNEPHADPPLATLDALLNNPADDRPLPLGLVLATWALDRTVFAPPGEHRSSIEQRSHDQREQRSRQPAFNDVEACADAVTSFAQAHGDALIARWRQALCLSNDERDDLRTTLTRLPDLLRWHALRVAQRKRLMAHSLWTGLWRLTQAVANSAVQPDAGGAFLQSLAEDIDALRQEGPIDPPPFVTGDDLIAAGRKPGPHFARLLEKVYDAQLENEVTSRDEAMAWIERAGE